MPIFRILMMLFWMRLPKLFSEFWPLAHEEYILLEKYTWNDNNNKKCFNFNKWIEISLDISRFIIIDQHFETKMSKNQNWSQIYWQTLQFLFWDPSWTLHKGFVSCIFLRYRNNFCPLLVYWIRKCLHSPLFINIYFLRNKERKTRT